MMIVNERTRFESQSNEALFMLSKKNKSKTFTTNIINKKFRFVPAYSIDKKKLENYNKIAGEIGLS